MTYSLINKCAKNYYNRTFIVQVIAKNVVTCFFLRHSVIVTGVSHYWKWSPRLSSTVIKRLKDNGVTTLISWGHVTSSVT